jgi:hypothetical protein
MQKIPPYRVAKPAPKKAYNPYKDGYRAGQNALDDRDWLEERPEGLGEMAYALWLDGWRDGCNAPLVD